MKLSLSKSPQADPTAFYTVAQGFSADAGPNYPGFAPKIGTRLRGSHPAVAYLISHGGSALFLEGDVTEGEVAAANADATFGHIPAVVDWHPGISIPGPIPPERRVAVVHDARVGDAGLIPAGTIYDADDPFVRAHRDLFAPVQD